MPSCNNILFLGRGHRMQCIVELHCLLRALQQSCLEPMFATEAGESEQDHVRLQAGTPYSFQSLAGIVQTYGMLHPSHMRFLYCATAAVCCVQHVSCP